MVFGTVGPPITPLNPQNRQDKRSPFHTIFWPQKSEVKESNPSEVVVGHKSEVQKSKPSKIAGLWGFQMACLLHLHPAIDFWRPESRTSGPRKAVRCSRANFRRSEMSPFTSMGWQGKGLHQHLEIGCNMGMGQNLVPLVNIKIAGKWMFIPPKMVLIGIDPYPYGVIPINFLLTVPESSEFLAAAPR